MQYQLHPISTQIAVVKGTPPLVNGVWIEQQGEELASHLVSRRDGRNARQQFLIRGGADAVSKGVDQRCPPRSLRPVFVGTMNHERVMEGTLSAFEFNWNRPESLLLFRR